MADKFVPAVEDLAAALMLGEDLETALVEIAGDHDVKPEALRNRATTAYGDLATYRERTGAASSAIAQMAREHLEYERELEAQAQKMRDAGYTKFTAQDAREANELLGRHPVFAQDDDGSHD